MAPRHAATSTREIAMPNDPFARHAARPTARVRRFLIPALVAFVAGGAPAQPTADATLARDFDEALAAYERNHWPEVYQMMSALAARGHPDAARIALQMWRHGPALYGRSFTASSAQVERWTQLWGCGGDATGRACEIAMRAP